MDAGALVCCGCGRKVKAPIDEAWAEAEAVFRLEELVEYGLLCDDCFHQLRVDMPDLDARYAEHGY